MAIKKQLKDKNGNTIYPDVGLNLDDVVYSDDPAESPDMSALGGVTVRSFSATMTQTIASGTETVVKFPVSESKSNAINYDANTGEFTAVYSGVYSISSELGGTAGPLTNEIFVRGAEYKSSRSLISGGTAYVSVSTTAYLNAGDKFMVKCYQTSGSSMVINSRAKGNIDACLIALA